MFIAFGSQGLRSRTGFARVAIRRRHPTPMTLNIVQQTRPYSQSGGKFLVDDAKFTFLKELGLESRNLGVYNGEWMGRGQVGL